jgi:hypothetical protein
METDDLKAKFRADLAGWRKDLSLEDYAGFLDWLSDTVAAELSTFEIPPDGTIVRTVRVSNQQP